jgi:hypothetical protein
MRKLTLTVAMGSILFAGNNWKILLKDDTVTVYEYNRNCWLTNNFNGETEKVSCKKIKDIIYLKKNNMLPPKVPSLEEIPKNQIKELLEK